MRVEELMTSSAVTVEAGQTLAEAREKMESLDVHALPVTDSEGELVGVVSTQDLLPGQERTLPVSRLMTSPVHTLAPDAPVSAAARLMYEHRHHHVVVLDGSRIVGMLSSLDLLKQLT